MTSLCGSVTKLYSLPKKHFHQGMQKRKKTFDDSGRWMSGGLHMVKTESINSDC